MKILLKKHDPDKRYRIDMTVGTLKSTVLVPVGHDPLITVKKEKRPNALVNSVKDGTVTGVLKEGDAPSGHSFSFPVTEDYEDEILSITFKE